MKAPSDSSSLFLFASNLHALEATQKKISYKCSIGVLNVSQGANIRKFTSSEKLNPLKNRSKPCQRIDL